jgi:hypothetical protein
MTQQHKDALEACCAAHAKAEALLRWYVDQLPDDPEDEDEDENLVSIFDAQRDSLRRRAFSWETAMGGLRVGIQALESHLLHVPTKRICLRFHDAIKEMKAALAMMERLPPWEPPSGGGGRRKAA